MEGTLTMMSERMLMIRAIFLPRAYSARKVPPRTPTGTPIRVANAGDHQLSDKGVPEPAAFDARGCGVIEEKADVQGAQAMDDDIGQDIDEPEQADGGRKPAQRAR